MPALMLALAIQAFTPWIAVDLTWVTGGAPGVQTELVVLGPGRTGLMIWLPQPGLMTVAVAHPGRSGYSGWNPAPGICYEPWTAVPLARGVNHLRRGDVDADGIDDVWLATDLMVETPSLFTLRIWLGTGLRYCR